MAVAPVVKIVVVAASSGFLLSLASQAMQPRQQSQSCWTMQRQITDTIVLAIASIAAMMMMVVVVAPEAAQ